MERDKLWLLLRFVQRHILRTPSNRKCEHERASHPGQWPNLDVWPRHWAVQLCQGILGHYQVKLRLNCLQENSDLKKHERGCQTGTFTFRCLLLKSTIKPNNFSKGQKPLVRCTQHGMALDGIRFCACCSSGAFHSSGCDFCLSRDMYNRTGLIFSHVPHPEQ